MITIHIRSRFAPHKTYCGRSIAKVKSVFTPARANCLRCKQILKTYGKKRR